MMRMIVAQLLAALVSLALSAPAALAQHPLHSHSTGPCCDGIKTVCRPEVGTKKTTKYWYDCKCEDLCLPKCGCPKFSLGNCFHKGCGNVCSPCPAPSCDTCHDCEKPRVVKKLIKFPKVVEESETKCVAEKVLVPHCPPPCPTPCHGAVIITAPPAKPAGELLPPPKTEKQ